MKIHLLRNDLIAYSSASAIEYSNGILYVIGDDVNYILCLDLAWNVVREIKLFDFEGNRIPKPQKPDLESACFVNGFLYILGSGSLSPQRDVAFIVHPDDGIAKKINTAAFFALFRDKALIKEINIEGFTSCKDKLLFFNRGNISQSNQLIITDHKILKSQFPDRFKVMPVQSRNLNNIQLGISGACYDSVNDILLLTASAEDTDNAYDDGQVLGSAVAVVFDAYHKLETEELIIDTWIDLEEVDDIFRFQKIESICIVGQENRNYDCVLVADNDDGSSRLFQISIEI